MEHGPAPDHRLLVVHEHADAHDLDPVGHRGDDHAVELGGRVVRTHHAGDGEAVDVGVHHPHAQALGGQGGGQGGRDRGLAHPALPGGHRVDAGQAAGFGEGDHRLSGAPAQTGAQLGALLVVHDPHTHLDAGDPLHGAHLTARVLAEGVLQGAPGDGQQDQDGDEAVVTDLDGPHHAQVGDRTAELGIDDAGQGLADGRWRGLWHASILGARPPGLTVAGSTPVRAVRRCHTLVSGQTNARLGPVPVHVTPVTP